MAVRAGDLWFEPDVLEADPGTTLAIHLANVGAAPHNIAFRFGDGEIRRHNLPQHLS
jgi:plastocyanin